MIFDWNDFHTLALELSQRDDEASKRSAISRLYYAIYWKSRTHLENEGFLLSFGEGSHTQVWNEYRRSGRTAKAIGFSGKRLHDNRVQSDYYDEIEDIEKLVEDSFQTAEKITFYLQQIEKNSENQQ